MKPQIIPARIDAVTLDKVVPARIVFTQSPVGGMTTDEAEEFAFALLCAVDAAKADTAEACAKLSDAV